MGKHRAEFGKARRARETKRTDTGRPEVRGRGGGAVAHIEVQHAQTPVHLFFLLLARLSRKGRMRESACGAPRCARCLSSNRPSSPLCPSSFGPALCSEHAEEISTHAHREE